MTDITRNDTHTPNVAAGPNRAESASSGTFTHEELVASIELLFFAYRDFTSDPDEVLAEYGFGRAHHRVLHFVYRNPGIRVADLLEILKITKQSLARVLKQLVTDGFISQRAGPDDRRERLLRVTKKGGRLAEKLMQLQLHRVDAALAAAGPGANEAARSFLLAMIDPVNRAQVQSLIKLFEGNGRSG